jgi:catechol 2,3-dioxygenase-like lactoylglutathione lyase family enzyme
MQIEGLDHVTIRCREADLPAIRRFWGEVVGLEEGRRPAFTFPGIWFWLNGRPLIHIAARAPAEDGPPGPIAATGPFDHLALRARGLEATRARLAALGERYEEAPVPGFPLHQIFLRDPMGIRVELTFAVPEPG